MAPTRPQKQSSTSPAKTLMSADHGIIKSKDKPSPHVSKEPSVPSSDALGSIEHDITSQASIAQFNLSPMAQYRTRITGGRSKLAKSKLRIRHILNRKRAWNTLSLLQRSYLYSIRRGSSGPSIDDQILHTTNMTRYSKYNQVMELHMANWKLDLLEDVLSVRSLETERKGLENSNNGQLRPFKEHFWESYFGHKHMPEYKLHHQQSADYDLMDLAAAGTLQSDDMIVFTRHGMDDAIVFSKELEITNIDLLNGIDLKFSSDRFALACGADAQVGSIQSLEDLADNILGFADEEAAEQPGQGLWHEFKLWRKGIPHGWLFDLRVELFENNGPKYPPVVSASSSKHKGPKRSRKPR